MIENTETGLTQEILGKITNITVLDCLRISGRGCI